MARVSAYLTVVKLIRTGERSYAGHASGPGDSLSGPAGGAVRLRSHGVNGAIGEHARQCVKVAGVFLCSDARHHVQQVPLHPRTVGAGHVAVPRAVGVAELHDAERGTRPRLDLGVKTPQLSEPVTELDTVRVLGASRAALGVASGNGRDLVKPGAEIR